MVSQGNLENRLRQLVSLSWEIFSQKVGSNLLYINKEASMQLQYAYILQQMLPLIIFKSDEKVHLELETTVEDGEQSREVDILLKGECSIEEFIIAIEMKCYKTISSSGKKRGATDIFMKDVYQDLDLLEKYCRNGEANIGISLVMVDYQNFINPKRKRAKCWDYDISDGTIIENIRLNTPVGGKDINIHLRKKYHFNWNSVGDYWFLELEGTKS